MAAFWPIGIAQIIRFVSYPIRKKSRFWLVCMWSAKEMYHALLPKADYRDKGRGHDRRLNVGWHTHQDLGQAMEISASVPAHLLISNRRNGKFMRRQVVSWASLVKWNSPANWAGSPQLNRSLYVTHPRFQTSLQGCPLLLCSQKVQFLATWMHLWWDLPDGMSETPFCYFVS